MKKRMLSFMVYGLALTLVMYNCSKGDPLGPNEKIMDGLKKIEMEKVEIEKSEPAKSTPGSFEASAKVAEIEKLVAQITPSGAIPANLKTSIEELSSVLNTTEVAALSGISPQTLAAMEAGAEAPANIRAILEKVANDPRLKAYMNNVVLPTLDESPLVDKTKGLQIPKNARVTSDPLSQCLNVVENQYNATVTTLQSNRTTQLAQVEATYQQTLTNNAATETSCISTATARYQPLRAAAQVSKAAAAAALEAAKSSLPLATYTTLKAMLNLGTVVFITQLNNFENTDKKVCTQTKLVNNNNALTARNNSNAAVELAYQNALAQANAAKAAAIALCEEQHDQG
ncbi:hypothetical protein [Runella zeae]|uniref:hypothetical protein n=1 Tax=Runella zeae TaxID=94255 RepID=UPI0023540D0E|nr:hypothetical protein [Runella zeae]